MGETPFKDKGQIMPEQFMTRLWMYGLHIPLRRFFHNLRDLSRRIRIYLKLREPLPPRQVELELPEVPWNRLCRSSGTLFAELETADGNVSPVELSIINALCATFRPRRIMEIGTFDGRTTLNLALNSGGEVFTLDIPSDEKAVLDLAPEDKPYFDKPRSAIGHRFLTPPNNKLPCVKRITQLYGDSATFDFSPWYGKIDLVFIDGSHSYDYVVNDTSVAMKLMRKEGGVILWHDYGEWPDVTKALNELRKKDSRLSPVHIRDTSLVASVSGSINGT